MLSEINRAIVDVAMRRHGLRVARIDRRTRCTAFVVTKATAHPEEEADLFLLNREGTPSEVMVWAEGAAIHAEVLLTTPGQALREAR